MNYTFPPPFAKTILEKIPPDYERSAQLVMIFNDILTSERKWLQYAKQDYPVLLDSMDDDEIKALHQEMKFKLEMCHNEMNILWKKFRDLVGYQNPDAEAIYKSYCTHLNFIIKDMKP